MRRRRVNGEHGRQADGRSKAEGITRGAWKIGDAADFLEMSDDERRLLDDRVEKAVRRRNRNRKREAVIDVENLFADLSEPLSGEILTRLVENPRLRIERIVSHRHASPPDFWYDQDQSEWVVVLRGAAKLQFEGQKKVVEMKPGDFVTITAHRRHRVAWTTPDEPTVWLAVHFGE